MRRLFVAIFLLSAAGCRRSHPPIVTEPAGFPAPSARTVAADLSVPPEATVFVPATAPEDERTESPTAAEIRARLNPLWPALKACVRAQGAFDAAVRLELHFRSEPSGEISDGLIVGLPGAHECTRGVLTSLRLPKWRGLATVVSIELTHTGDPLMIAVDGGQ